MHFQNSLLGYSGGFLPLPYNQYLPHPTSLSGSRWKEAPQLLFSTAAF